MKGKDSGAKLRKLPKKNLNFAEDINPGQKW